MTDLNNLQVREEANAHDLNPIRAAKELTRHKVQRRAAGVASGSDIAEVELYSVPAHLTDGVRVVSVKIVPDGAVTADDTGYATILVKKYDAAGANGATVASQTTKITGGSGDWVAFVPVTIPLAATLETLVAGGSLTLQVDNTSAAGGVAAGVPDLLVVTEVEEI